MKILTWIQCKFAFSEATNEQCKSSTKVKNVLGLKILVVFKRAPSCLLCTYSGGLRKFPVSVKAFYGQNCP